MAFNDADFTPTKLDMQRRARSHDLQPGLLILSYVLLTVAWIFGNPPGAAPDEPSHYFRALSLAHGEVVGESPSLSDSSLAQMDPLQVSRVTIVTIPRRMNSLSFACNAFRPDISGECFRDKRLTTVTTQQITTAGRTEPFLYVLPGFLARAGNDAIAGIRLGRIGSGATALSLIALGILLLSSRTASGFPLLGALVAVTPMMIFVASSLSPNGPEIAAAFCFLAAIRISRQSLHPNWVWFALGMSGTVLALSRSLGPVWLVLSGGLLAGILGPKAAWARVKAGGRISLAAISVVILAVTLNVLWGIAFLPGLPIHTSEILTSVLPSLSWLPESFRQQIGVFGWLDSRMPPLIYFAWTVMVVTLLTLAFLVGTKRQRWITALLITAAVGVTVGLAAMLSSAEVGIQGRSLS